MFMHLRLIGCRYIPVVVLISISIHFSHCQDVCTSFEDYQKCSFSPAWAVDTPWLNVTHNFLILKMRSTFIINYELVLENSSVISLCGYIFSPSGICQEALHVGNYCQACSNNYATNNTLVSKFSIEDVGAEKNGSILRYFSTLSPVTSTTIQQLLLRDCPNQIANAEAVDCPRIPCGYGCVCQYRCSKGFYSNPRDSSMIECTASAQWNASDPVCSAFAETTSTVSSTTPAATEISTNTSTLPSGKSQSRSTQAQSRSTQAQSRATQAATAIGVIGGLCIVAAILLEYYKFSADGNQSENLKSIIAASLCVVAVWAIALGILLGVDNFAAFVAGTVLGLLAMACMAGLIVYLILQIKNDKNKGIKGKQIEEL